MRETKVRIDPFGFVGLEDIRIDQKVNEHARAVVYGLLDSEHIDGYREFFGGKKEFLDAKVKMLYGDGDGDIISQYVDFTKVYQEQARLLGRTVEAVRETIRICKNKDVLREYLSTHEKEVVSIMMALFDQEKAVEQFGYEREQKGREEGGFEMARRTAANMFKDGEPIDKIARFLEFPPETILSWVGKS